jgi:hypothetical protein
VRYRPASRKKPVVIVPATELASDISDIRREGGYPAAIITGTREWAMVRNQVDAAQHLQFWPGDGETFDQVPVIIRPGVGAPRVMATQQDLEDALLGGD